MPGPCRPPQTLDPSETTSVSGCCNRARQMSYRGICPSNHVLSCPLALFLMPRASRRHHFTSAESRQAVPHRPSHPNMTFPILVMDILNGTHGGGASPYRAMEVTGVCVIGRVMGAPGPPPVAGRCSSPAGVPSSGVLLVFFWCSDFW